MKCINNDSIHTNAFVDLNGIPYVVAEYLDKNQFRQVDRSQIKSEIFVDQSESMRALIDISIDDIGKRSSDGLPAVIGNNSKQKKLLGMIDKTSDRFNNQLNVLKRGIIMRVCYQLENHGTGQIIRSMTEDLRITDRNYFLDINPRNVDDNAIIVNFSNSLVSTINEFTHGRNRMALRITNIQMLYECVKSSPKMPRIKQSLGSHSDGYYPTECCDGNVDYYQYHETHQHHHVIGIPGCNDTYGNESVEMISPNKWSLFNRFYHFDNHGKDIIFHKDEIYDPMTETVLVPCGSVTVNKCFMINPGHRIVFKFSVWKNDVTVVSNTERIAEMLKAPSVDHYYDDCYHDHHHHDHNDYHEIMNAIEDNRRVIMRMNNVIKDIVRSDDRKLNMIKDLSETVKALKETVQKYHPEEIPEPDNDCSCGCDHSEINKKLDEIEKTLDDIKDNECECGDAMTIEEVEDMINMFK